MYQLHSRLYAMQLRTAATVSLVRCITQYVTGHSTTRIIFSLYKLTVAQLIIKLPTIHARKRGEGGNGPCIELEESTPHPLPRLVSKIRHIIIPHTLGPPREVLRLFFTFTRITHFYLPIPATRTANLITELVILTIAYLTKMVTFQPFKDVRV
jgi:hypothetical protein